MTDKEKYINSILEDVLTLDNPSLAKNRTGKFLDFVKLTINGNIPESHLAFNANLRTQERGIIIYILTNIKIIRIEIDSTEMKSSSFLLENVLSIERRLLDNETIEVKLVFLDELSFGLHYVNTKDSKVPSFFQKLEELRDVRRK